MEQHLATTNVLLGIMAAVSVLEALLLVGVGVAGFLVYRHIMAAIRLLDGFEQRQIAPLVARVHTVIDDVKGVTSTVREETERVDHAIRTTIDRVDHTADRVRSSMRAKSSRVVGILRGLRVAIEGILVSRDQPPADAARRF